jgi:hypothetical protein
VRLPPAVQPKQHKSELLFVDFPSSPLHGSSDQNNFTLRMTQRWGFGQRLGPRSRDLNNEKRKIKEVKRKVEEQIKGIKVATGLCLLPACGFSPSAHNST